MRAYYNENDPYAAAMLENLIAAGEIAPGDVDTRSILDVMPADLDGYTQCHFFAGVGVWSRALREAGWPDDRPVWTGSCPCQPFSAAGAGLGFDDDRHLFPGWHWLIQQHRPPTIFGEQVASPDGLEWADLVQAAMEATEYACGFVDTCAAGFRSFHIRQRLYFAAEDLEPATGGMDDGLGAGLERHGGDGGDGCEPRRDGKDSGRSATAAGSPDGLADTRRGGVQREQQHGDDASQAGSSERETQQREWRGPDDSDGSAVDRLPHPTSEQLRPWRIGAAGDESREIFRSARSCPSERLADGSDGGRGSGAGLRDRGPRGIGGQKPADHGGSVGLADSQSGGRRIGRHASQPGKSGHDDSGRNASDLWADPADGYWRDADWLYSRDGKWRPVEPGTFPLAHAAPARMGRLRAYGNALDLAQATGFVRAYLERDLGKQDIVANDFFEWMDTQ